MSGHRSAARRSAERVTALVRRYLYLLRGSWARIIELAYWPTMQMILWGFMTQFLAAKTTYVAHAFGVLLSAVLLWDVLFRSQIGVAMSFMEEMWSRNLGHLFVSPLRVQEMIAGLLLMSLVRTLIGIVPASLLAILFFDYSIYGLGLPLVAFFACLVVMGWAVGLVVSGLVLVVGQGAESLAWVCIFALAPVSGIWYPLEVLPPWLQVVASGLPSAHVFEGMRAILIDGAFRADLLWNAILLDVVYLGAGSLGFLALFRIARRDGQLLQMGE